MVRRQFRTRRSRGGRWNFHHLLRRALVATKMKPELYPRLYLWLVAHSRAVLLTAGLIAVGCVAISSRIDLEEDILGILPQRDPIVDDYKYTLNCDSVYISINIALLLLYLL